MNIGMLDVGELETRMGHSQSDYYKVFYFENDKVGNKAEPNVKIRSRRTTCRVL